MRARIRTGNSGIALAIFIVKVVLGITIALGTIGVFLLRAAGKEYFSLMEQQKRCTEKVTATVESVDKKDDEGTVTGYMTLSYEYNGRNYVTEMECYSGHYMHYSSDGRGSDEESGAGSSDLQEKLDDSWAELQASVGTQYEIMIDPDSPEIVTMAMDAKDMGAFRTLMLIGIAPFLIIALLIVLLIALLMKKKKSLTEQFEEGF